MRFKFLSILFLIFITSTCLISAQDDFDFDDETPTNFNTEAAEDSFDEFDDGSEAINANPTDLEADDADDFDFNEEDEEDDGQVEDGEDEYENVVKDSFDDFGDDQVMDTGDEKKEAGQGEKRRFTEKGSNTNRLREANVPSHLRQNWNQFWIEGILIMLIIYYIINYFQGKGINQEIANMWMRENLNFLQTQFYKVGGASKGNPDETPTLSSNSSNCFTIWCTGRKGCEGMLVEMKLVARQDLVTVWKNRFNKKRIEGIDFITFSYYFEDGSFGDPIVACVGEGRLTGELWKNFSDLRTFCPKGPKEKSNISKSFTGCAENVEMLNHIFDTKTISTFTNSEDFPTLRLGYMHISDRYESMYVEDENNKKLELELRKKVLVTSLIVDPEAQKENNKTELDSLNYTKGIIYIADKIKRFKLSKEAKAACDKRRAKAVEEEQKKMHAVRTERAAERTELKRREMNKKIMEEEDPEKQRRMFQQQQDRDARKSKKFKMKMK